MAFAAATISVTSSSERGHPLKPSTKAHCWLAAVHVSVHDASLPPRIQLYAKYGGGEKSEGGGAGGDGGSGGEGGGAGGDGGEGGGAGGDGGEGGGAGGDGGGGLGHSGSAPSVLSPGVGPQKPLFPNKM